MDRNQNKTEPRSFSRCLPCSSFFPILAWIAFLTIFCALEQHASAQDQPPTLKQIRQTGIAASVLRNLATPSAVESLEPRLADFRDRIAPILAESCVDCHGPDEIEGNVRIDTLNPDLFHGQDVDWWLEVLAVLSKGEMPPDEGELSEADRTTVVDWLTTELHAASVARRAEGGHSSFRRMTRYEYNYALQDLLGLPYDFAKDLPPDANSEDGFLNSSETLHMTVSQFATYRELGLAALRKATVVDVAGPRPKPVYWGASMRKAALDCWDLEERELKKRHKGNPEKLAEALERFEENSTRHHSQAHYKNLETSQTRVTKWNYGKAKFAFKPTPNPVSAPASIEYLAVLPRRQRLVVELGDQVPEYGTLRVRFRASQKDFPDVRAANLQLEFGWQASNDSRASVRISEHDINITGTPDHPGFYQWDIPLSEVQPRNTMRGRWPMGGLPNPSEFLTLVNSSDSHGDIQIDFVEVSAGVLGDWPPRSHQRLFFNSPNKADEKAYATEILRRFMNRAWRRSATKEELEQKLKLFEGIRPQCDSFEQTALEVMSTVLASPNFLYLSYANEANANRTDAGRNEDSRQLSADELATRLSMFLWSSIPDDELLRAARDRQLSGEELREQVKRMLADPKADRFSKQFVRQWLGMQLLDYLQSDGEAYPDFDDKLKEAMQAEPIALFKNVLDGNHSVLDFIHNDYGVVNQRLARHYGLSDVWGSGFQRVDFLPEHRRGGLLTQAGLLAMNSDGKDSHPLKRGVWLLERILNDPPPPPPAAVPEIDLADPAIAKMTLKQRIENHRNQAACMSCHAKIDPWGIAFENFDAVGGWRTKVDGKQVDATSELSNQQQLSGMDGLKRYLLADRQDQFVTAIVHKMTTYALGRPLTFADRSMVAQVAADLRRQDDGLATLVELIVMSELFQAR